MYEWAFNCLRLLSRVWKSLKRSSSWVLGQKAFWASEAHGSLLAREHIKSCWGITKEGEQKRPISVSYSAHRRRDSLPASCSQTVSSASSQPARSTTFCRESGFLANLLLWRSFLKRLKMYVLWTIGPLTLRIRCPEKMTAHNITDGELFVHFCLEWATGRFVCRRLN